MNTNKGVLVDPNKVYTLEETASLLKVKKSTLTNPNYLMGKKVGKRYLFSGENIHNYLGTVSQ